MKADADGASARHALASVGSDPARCRTPMLVALLGKAAAPAFIAL